MKKFTILALAALLVVAFTVPAAALENVFGGYWRTRFFTNIDFTGEDQTEAQDYTVVDTRTRLYYTAVLNDNLKFVSKVEFDTVWGTGPLGDIGADGKELEIKNAHIDANLWGLNWKLGIQGYTFARGFLFSDDFSGAVVTYKSDMVDVPFVWVKAHDDGAFDANTFDVDFYAVNPKFKMGGVSLNPFFLYAVSNNNANQRFAGSGAGLPTFDRLDAYYIGVNADFDLGPAGLWFTGIYNGGDGEIAGSSTSLDFKGYLLALGLNVGVGPVDVHGEIFYASGDDDATDNDIDAFVGVKGQSYYWSEIMGYGIFDKQVSNGSPADQISNIIAYNAGVSVKPTDKLKATLDLWYATLAEDNANGDKDLGFEVDLILNYKLMDGLNLDLVGAYLFADDATDMRAAQDADPYELGARVSISF